MREFTKAERFSAVLFVSLLVAVPSCTKDLSSSVDFYDPNRGPCQLQVAVVLGQATLEPTQTTQASFLATTPDGEQLGQNPSWSSLDTKVATVTSTGLVTAVSVGTVAIRAALGSCLASMPIAVKAPDVQLPRPAIVAVAIDSPSIAVGHVATASAVVKDSAGNMLSGQSVTWSSLATSVATVSPSGAVTALAAGTAVVKAAVGTLEGTSSIVVNASTSTPPPPPPPVVASVVVAIDSSSLTVGNVSQARATAKDASGVVISGLAVTWTSLSASIASVSSAGSVKGLAVGSASIQATISGVSGSRSITVVAVTPPPPPPVGVLATSDFSSGTISPYINNQPPIPGGEIGVVADPTGTGHGNVARLHYHHFTSPDRNVALEFDHGILPGQSVYFSGDFYVATADLKDFGRKLLYWQPHANYTKYGSNTDGGASFSSVVGMEGPDLLIDNFHVDHTGQGFHDQHYISRTMVPNRWYRLEMQTTAENPVGARNGICRIWLDGVLIYESTTTNWVDAAMIGQPLPGGNGTPLAAADIYFEYLLVGQQVNDNSNSAYDEYRYWDNVTFSTTRAP